MASDRIEDHGYDAVHLKKESGHGKKVSARMMS